MLFAASTHNKNDRVSEDPLAAIPLEASERPGSSVECTFSADIHHAKPPARATHTPQQLAFLEASARARENKTPESATVSDEEKYLAAQLVYLASQHHNSEYNRQKVNQNQQPVYVPLSIQLPSHVRDLRVRQAQFAQCQAWFITEHRDRLDNTALPDSRSEDQVNHRESDLFIRGRPARQLPVAPLSMFPSYGARHSTLVQLHSTQASLLQDALGSSVLSGSSEPLTSTGSPTKHSTSVLPSPTLHLPSTPMEVDEVATPPPLPELRLSPVPSPVRIRPSGYPSPITTSSFPCVAGGQLGSWPHLPLRPTSVHVTPTPTLQLQLALEAAISRDLIPDLEVDGQPLPGIPKHLSSNKSDVLRGAPENSSPSGEPRLPQNLRLMMLPKTSETHPISISQIIPTEYMATIASNLEKYPYNPSPENPSTPRGSYFRVPPRFRLDYVLYTLAIKAYETRAVTNQPPSVQFETSVLGLKHMHTPPPVLRPMTSEPILRRLPQKSAAMSVTPRPTTPPPENLVSEHVMSISRSLAPAFHDNIAEEPYKTRSARRLSTSKHGYPAPITPPTLPFMLRAPPAPALMTLRHPSPVPNDPYPSNPTRPNGDVPVLGNLYVSSCPGKKVRLNGPIKGRGAICRDLGVDLARIKSIGVHLVVCCLDDDELEFLGAPWPEYEDTIKVVGLDVLRLPMPEGLGPLSVQAMSKHMDRIISDYTLDGRHVLVHCRGGVGRAGLVACTWMLKLGICGSVEPSGRIMEWRQEAQVPAERLLSEDRVAPDTLELLERIIYVIRRQRSVKAIETYEQVRFLLEFIEYLRYADTKM